MKKIKLTSRCSGVVFTKQYFTKNRITNGMCNRNSVFVGLCAFLLLFQLNIWADPIAQKAHIEKLVSIGSNSSQVIILEFTDYQCPYCKKFFINTFPEIKSEYIDRGAVKHVIVDYPQPDHKFARLAAKASLYANTHEKYWDARSELLNKSHLLDKELIYEIINISPPKQETFEEFLLKKELEEILVENKKLAQKLGIKPIPSFIIYLANDTPENGKVIIGAQEFDVFDKVIKKLMNQ